MKEIIKNTDRRGWVAAIAGLTMPGMGQIYNGELFKGLCLFTIFGMVQLVGFKLALALPGKYLMTGIAVTLTGALALHVYLIIEAYRAAARHGKGYQPKAYNRWYFYIATWMFCSIFVFGFSSDYARKNLLETFKIVTRSMQPEVMPGDFVIVDKTAYQKFSPRVGDIVVHVFPDDRSKVLIRRIEGLPGEKITLEDGQNYTVPHGSIYVLGNNKTESMDSRKFGTVPLRDVVGKARQIFFSRGADGVRWNRIGQTMDDPVK